MKKHAILVVDDAPENIDILLSLLKDDYSLKAATNGTQALKIATGETPPDVILLDIMMPGMNGFEVCGKLKALRKTRDIPVIFITAVSEMDALVKGFELGGADYIVKPFNAAELRTRLRTHLSLREATATLKNRSVILAQLVNRKTGMLRRKNDLLEEALREKDALLREVRAMDEKLRDSLARLNLLYVRLDGLQEEERKNLAAEIHDRMGQLLTAVKLNLFRLRPKDGADDGRVDETIGMVDEAIKNAQNLSMRLRPDILDHLGFAEAVRWYCRVTREASGIECVAEVAEDAGLDPKTELVLYRVIQEAVTNVIRHARARSCAIRITRAANGVRLEVSDDGVGIDGGRIADINSLGLYGMRKRVADLGGELGVAGIPGKGTAVTASIPVRGDR